MQPQTILAWHIRGICLKHSVLHLKLLLASVAIVFAFITNVAFAANAGCGAIPQGQVSRAIFTTQVQDREPVDQVLILESKYDKVYFFTDLRHFEGQEIIHRWEHNGHVIAEKEFAVKGPRWRVYSTQQLDASMLGRWTVVVTDKNGCPLKAAVFDYVATDPKGEGTAIINLK